MQPYAVRRILSQRPKRIRARTWERTRPRENRPANGTYLDLVATSADVNRQRFARFVARVLADARDRGMTDSDIAKATGVGSSTFHRWQAGNFRKRPELEKIKTFCEGLGVPVRAAMLALGIEDGRDETAPEPALDPDVRRILRALADPGRPDEEKRVIREMLKMIAARTRQTGRMTDAAS